MSSEQPDRSPAGPAGRTVARAAPDRGRALTGSTLEFLIGDWNVVRQISDSRSGRRGSFLGTAQFSPARGIVRYTEQGELTFGDHRGPARRALQYAAGPGGAADVRFADGREFFCLDLRSGSCRAEHVCGPDRYQVTVTRVSQDSFTETWQVEGPAKDYEMTTRYLRAGQAPAAGSGRSGHNDVWTGSRR